MCGDPWMAVNVTRAGTPSAAASAVQMWNSYEGLEGPERKASRGLLKPAHDDDTRVFGILLDTGERGITQAARMFAKRRMSINVHLGESDEWDVPR